MSVTLGDYDAALIAKGYDATAVANRTAAINVARRLLVTRRSWTWLETETTSLATIVGTAAVSLSGVTNLAHLDAVRLSFGNDEYPIDYMQPQVFKDEQQYNGSRGYNSIPQYWTYYAVGLQFTPRPDKIYVVTLDYLAKLANLTAIGDVCPIPDQYQDVVSWEAAKQLAFRGRDQAGLAMAESQYQSALQDASRADTRAQRQTDSSVTQTRRC